MGNRLPPAPTQAEVKSILDAAWAAWCTREGTAEAITRRIHAKLEKGADQILFKLMGFENRAWHGDTADWRIDHCNGRSGESLIGDYLKEKVQAAAEAWIDEQAGKLPKLPRSALNDLSKEYEENFRRAVRERLHELARRHGEETAVRMFDEARAAAEGTPGEGAAKEENRG